MNSGNRGPSAGRAGRLIVRAADSVLDTAVLLLFLLLLAVGCYSVWDSGQVQTEAASSGYEQYRPDGEDSLSFAELREQNPDVFGWLTVYGTNIDYPLVQGKDNDTYLNTDAKGEYSLSGALFLDYRNSTDLSDFNSIIYGHHMAGGVMFGEIGSFQDQEYFNSHRYGSIYCDGRYYGLEFFAFLQTDAYNEELYRPAVSGEEQEAYLTLIRETAVHCRETGAASGGRLVLLSTCTSNITNGRHILVGKLTEKPEEDPFAEKSSDAGYHLFSAREKPALLYALSFIIIVIMIPGVIMWRKRRKNKEETGGI